MNRTELQFSVCLSSCTKICCTANSRRQRHLQRVGKLYVFINSTLYGSSNKSITNYVNLSKTTVPTDLYEHYTDSNFVMIL